MKRIASASVLALLLLAACDTPTQPLPTPPPDVPLRMTAAVTPTPTMPAYYIVVGEGTYIPATPFPTVPAPTMMPLPTPTQPSAVKVNSINPNRLPRLTQDLAFLDADALRVWRHNRSAIEPLINVITSEPPALGKPLPAQTTPEIKIQAYNVQAGVDKIALRFSYQNRVTFVGAYDVKTLAITPLGEASQGLLGPDMLPARFLQFSPDGRWLAYVTSEYVRFGSASGKGRGVNAPASGGGSLSGSVSIVPIDGRTAPVELGDCLWIDSLMKPCDGFVWSPDSSQLAWSDGRGIWAAGVDAKARLLQSVEGQMFGMPTMHRTVLSWSPNGQWVLTRDHIQAGASFALVEVASGRRVTLEQSWLSMWSPQQSLWLKDGSLVVAAPGNGKMKLSPALLRYRIAGVNSVDAIVPEQMGAFAFPSANMIFGLVIHDNGDVGFGVTNADASDDRSRGIYRFSIADSTARKLNDLPVFVVNYGGAVPAALMWSRDGASAVYVTPESALLISAIDSPLNDLRSLSKQPYASLCCFTWLP